MKNTKPTDNYNHAYEFIHIICAQIWKNLIIVINVEEKKMGLVVRKCHFYVTACAEERRLAQRAERFLRDLSALGPAEVLRAPAG